MMVLTGHLDTDLRSLQYLLNKSSVVSEVDFCAMLTFLS